MANFTIQQGYFFLCSDISSEEKRKLNDFLLILEESGVGKIIEEAVGRKPETGGRPSYSPYRLFATLLYAFSRHFHVRSGGKPGVPERQESGHA